MARGLPKSIIKKYGITKKAWQVYRGRKTRKTTKSTAKKGRGKRKTVKKVISRAKPLLGNLSLVGAIEALAVKFIAGAVFRGMGQGANAVPAANIAYGISGHVLGRRGKACLVHGVIDYVDNWLLSLIGMGVGAPPTTKKKIPAGIGVPILAPLIATITAPPSVAKAAMDQAWVEKTHLKKKYRKWGRGTYVESKHIKKKYRNLYPNGRVA